MTTQYASKLPSGASNSIKNVAIVGATGSIGKHLTEELLKTGKHNLTAITRGGSSSSSLPSGVTSKQISYDDHASIVEGLKGQDALIITMAVTAPKDTQRKLIAAAKDAGVKWIVPNEWGFATDDEEDEFGKDIMLGPGIAATRSYIKELGLNFIGMTSGFWFQFSLGGSPDRYGFDFKKRELILFDGGDTKILTSTWPQTGRAIATILSLPILPKDESDKDLTVSHWRNKTVHINSFYVSQNEMFAEVLKATGTTKADWKITEEGSHERFERASKLLASGDYSGMVLKLYSRCFYPDDKKNLDFRSQLDNEKLGLPKEDFPAAVKEAIEFALAEDDGKY